jgi:hypothetical protein
LQEVGVNIAQNSCCSQQVRLILIWNAAQRLLESASAICCYMEMKDEKRKVKQVTMEWLFKKESPI